MFSRTCDARLEPLPMARRRRTRTGILRTLTAGLVFAASVAGAQTFNGSGAAAIPDGGGGTPPNWGTPLDVTFNVSGMTESIVDISLSLTFSSPHTWVGDLDVVLAPPGITPGDPGSFVIFSRVGATTAGDFGDSSNLNGVYTFTNNSANNLWTVATTGCDTGCTVTAQSYRTSAAGPATIPAANTDFTAAFSSLTPAQLNGTWTLRLRDGASGDTGTLGAAALTLSQPMPGPAQDGDVTLTGTFALNSYTTLAGAAAAGATTLTVSSVAALTLPTCGAGCSNSGATVTNGLGTPLAVSDLLMIYQPQELGGTITTTNSTDFGAVSGTGYGSAGLYEFVYVASVSGSVITIDTSGGANCTGLKRSYDSGAMVIRVPQLRNLTISSGGVLNPASAWNGSTGGVIALDVRPGSPLVDSNGTIAINGTGRISASGFGFRGGAIDNQTTGANTNNATTQAYAANNCAAGARKGESVLGWAGDANGGTCGSTADNNETGSYGSGAFNRGALANGGGGGNSHNAGGGGGSNVGSGTWTGGGNPDRGAANVYDAAWNLDDNADDLNDNPTVTPTSTSPGGGRGGYTYSSSNQNALTLKPGCNLLAGGTCAANWGGDSRLNRGGLGGRPLDQRPNADTVDRIYFGGGGGAGDGNNDASTAGAAGGGLVFLIARRIVTDAASVTTLISSDGANGQTTLTAGALSGNDAPGGGGGGGTIVALVNQAIESEVRFSVVGGTGGSQSIDIGPEAEGPGGGGGGGVVAASWNSGTPAFLLNGGNSGISQATNASDAMTEFPLNGGTRGGAGLLVSAPPRNSTPFLCLQDGGDFTTPVTNTYFSSTRTGAVVDVRFTTSAEAGNLGFQLYGEADGRRFPVGQMILSPEGDSPLPQDYRVTLDAQRFERLYLGDLSVSGKEAIRGPFVIGASYGAQPRIRPYDWSTAHSEVAAHAASRSAGTGSVAYVRVSERGMQRVSYESLQAAGVDLAGVPAGEIAMVGRQGPVVRRVRGASTFGPGSVIEFFGDPTPDLYSRTETFLVRRDAASVRDMPLARPMLLPAGPESQQWATVRYAPETRYGFASPTPDPWYAARVVANGGPASYDFAMNAEGAISTQGVLRISLWGGIDYPAGPLPDHHVRVLLNGVAVADVRFDGFIPWNGEIPVDNLVAGVNTVRLEMPRDTGYPADLVNLDSIEISYLRMPAFTQGRLYGAGMRPSASVSDLLFADGLGDSPTGPAPLELATLTLPGLGSSTRNFRIDGGNPSELELAMGRSIDAGALGETSEIWMSEPAGLVEPAVSPAPDFPQIENAPADYWVITHGLFANALQPLLAMRQQQGLATRMVDVEQIYLAYSAGNRDPQAIVRFVREVAAPAGARYLMLVGGDTYDAPGYLNSGSISFIPTIYQRTNEIVAFAPADPLFGDLTGDGIAEISVGRLPVRTQAEAAEAVRKIIAYDTQPAAHRILSVAGAADTGQGISFRAASEAFQTSVPAGFLQSSVYVDTLGVAAAKAAVVSGFDAGQSLVSYVGHSSPTQWGFEQVLTSAQVPALAPNANAPLVLQFGCWTTYFVIPTANSMSHALMLTPSRGASGVLGSTVLLDQPSHDRMAAAIAPRLVAGRRIGDVLLEAKREVAVALDSPLDGTEVFVGISLMGDPAQQIR